MKISYRPAAIKDIQRTVEYIEDNLKNPTAAETFKRKVLHGISLLKENPEMGQLMRNKEEEITADYRYIIINKHLIFYELNPDSIEIVRILDGRTDYLTILL